MKVLADWHKPGLGTRVRLALWLASEAGRRDRFRKQRLLDVIPGFEQIDRRGAIPAENVASMVLQLPAGPRGEIRTRLADAVI